ncbi:MAG: flagellar assembly protein FliW [Acidobacteria bacterium]|nr:flagellar assembly protein FliW [Acidobacteriota bacterium]
MIAAGAERTVTFPNGLPGFEHSRHFVIVTAPAFSPFTLIQGEGEAAPAFVAIDPRLVDPGYRTDLEDDDRDRLAAEPGQTLLWLALVTATAGGHATVNLKAPLVINPASMQGLQVLPADSPYRLDHPLPGM